MNQSNANKLISKLRYKLHDRRNLRNPDGPQGRHNKIRKTVTALFKYERIEMNYHRADESRGYAERLISDAIRYGDCHEPTMEMAKYWLLEPQIVHKLFKVLVPRYQNFAFSYTKLWRGPNIYPGHGRPKCVLELKNNIFPPLGDDKSFNKNLIHNVLLSAARAAYNFKEATEYIETYESTGEKINTDGLKSKNDESAAPLGNSIESNDVSVTDENSKNNLRTDTVNRSEIDSSGEVKSLEKNLRGLDIKGETKETSSEEKK